LKKIKFLILAGTLVLSLLGLNSCSSGSLMDNPEMYKEQVRSWIDRTLANPKDFEALKNLSVYYMQTHDNDKARYYLGEAMEIHPDDPELIFYKGLNLEFYNEEGKAAAYYARYKDVPEDSPFRDMLEGRYLWIKRQEDYSDVKDLIQNEKDLTIQNVSDSTIAVFPLIYQGTNAEYAPLSRGFSEMVSIDLAKLKDIKVLERVRIQAVLDELKVAQSNAVDQSTAPRVGKILQAGTIVSGDYDVTDNGEFKIDLGSWEVQSSQRKSWVNKTGSLKDLFVLQKQVVFAFLQENGFQLTQEEKENIAYIPTQNLEAFLAYSKGLLQEDAGNYQQAGQFFNQATQLDPNFRDAGGKLQSSQSLGKSGGKKEALVTTLRKTAPVVKNEMINLAASRLESLATSIVSNFVQGVDTRNPVQELLETVGLFQDLPSPPPPPPPPLGK
jgi:tetratricopeptide (TPR) repeat protein